MFLLGNKRPATAQKSSLTSLTAKRNVSTSNDAYDGFEQPNKKRKIISDSTNLELIQSSEQVKNVILFVCLFVVCVHAYIYIYKILETTRYLFWNFMIYNPG
jgi:hypothetical protein